MRYHGRLGYFEINLLRVFWFWFCFFCCFHYLNFKHLLVSCFQVKDQFFEWGNTVQVTHHN